MITVVAGDWIPLAAELMAVHADDSAETGKLLVRGKCRLPADIGFTRGDPAYNTPLLTGVCHFKGWQLVATRRGTVRSWRKCCHSLTNR